MATCNLTAHRIESFKFPPDAKPNKRFYLWDKSENGLGVALYPSGRHKFVFRYRDALNKQHIVTLGAYGSDWPDLNVPRARKAATVKRAEVVVGTAPVEALRAAEMAFGKLCDRFIEDYARHFLRQWKMDSYRIERYLKPALGTAKVATLPRSAVLELHRRIGTQSCERVAEWLGLEEDRAKRCPQGGGESCKGHPVQANRVIALVRRIINWAKEEGTIPVSTPNPAARMGRRRRGRFRESRGRYREEQKADRALRPEEVSRLMPHVLKLRNPRTRIAFWLAGLTALRHKSELLTLTWERINLTDKLIQLSDRTRLPARSLFIPADLNKSERDFILPLSGPAVRLLEELAAHNHDGSDWAFPSRSKEKHFVSIEREVRKVGQKAEIEGFVMHDWRAVVATWARNRREEPEHIIARMLNHARPAGVTQRYLDDVPLDRIRQSFEAHAKMLLKFAGVDDALALVRRDYGQEAEVIPLGVRLAKGGSQ